MSATTDIEWTRGDDGTPGATWNVVTGCDEVSTGCDLCFARTFAERWRGTPGHYFENGFDVMLRPKRLTLPLGWRKPRRIFVNSMSDLFHKDVPDEFIAQAFAVMAATPRHTFQILTKRHGRMRTLLSSGRFAALVQTAVEHLAHLPGTWQLPAADYDSALELVFTERADEPMRPLPNVHLGVSVEDQKAADLRIPALLETPAAVQWISAEPLLGPVDLRRWTAMDLVCGCGQAPDGAPGAFGCSAECMQPERSALSWVVVGGESGHGARPMDERWARDLVAQCQAAGTPAFVKQMGSVWAKGHGLRGKGGDPETWAEDLRVRQMPAGAL